MRQSAYSTVVARPALAVALRPTGTYNGLTVDRAYQNNMFRSLMFSIHTGTLTDGTITFVVQESADNSLFTTADPSVVQGTSPTILATDDDKVFELGYNGGQRYVRLVATVATGATGGTWGATAVLMGARRLPAIH
jgi:hypothetical protein